MRWSRPVSYPSTLAATLAMVVLLLAGEVALGCPNCSASLSQQESSLRTGVPAGALAAAYNWGILFLLSLPFAVIGTLVTLIARLHRPNAGGSALPDLRTDG